MPPDKARRDEWDRRKAAAQKELHDVWAEEVSSILDSDIRIDPGDPGDSGDSGDSDVITKIRALRHNHAYDCEPRHKFRERYCTCGTYQRNEVIEEVTDVLIKYYREQIEQINAARQPDANA